MDKREWCDGKIKPLLHEEEVMCLEKEKNENHIENEERYSKSSNELSRSIGKQEAAICLSN